MKISRRSWVTSACALPALQELVFAQHAAITGDVPLDTVWLNANESPEGPPEASRRAMAGAISDSGRYNHRALITIQASIAGAIGVDPGEILLGNGSSEVLHCALEAFTSSTRPLITSWPTWEMMAQIAEKSGRRVVKVPLIGEGWTADVERLAAEAGKHPDGALVHIGNPNNPTSTLTGRKALRWLVEKLPANTQLVLDEAYMDYVENPEESSGMAFVKQRKNVIVTRTFSKLYGLAGARIGFACAQPELIKQMQVFRENVVSILGARAAEAAIGLGKSFVDDRRKARTAVRSEFCRWLTSQRLEYLPPAANFVLIRLPMPVVEVIPRMLALGVAVGRRFDTLDNWMRVAIGTAAEMKKVREQLPVVLRRVKFCDAYSGAKLVT